MLGYTGVPDIVAAEHIKQAHSGVEIEKKYIDCYSHLKPTDTCGFGTPGPAGCWFSF